MPKSYPDGSYEKLRDLSLFKVCMCGDGIVRPYMYRGVFLERRVDEYRIDGAIGKWCSLNDVLEDIDNRLGPFEVSDCKEKE